MKNVTSLKSTKIESPKTPGGISKSLLTPCRRVGLSRNWKKAGPSPFVSPITSANSSTVEVKVEKKPTRKRKERVEEEIKDEDSEVTPEKVVQNNVPIDATKNDVSLSSSQRNDELPSTPSRHVDMPQRKRSKILLSEVTCKENDEKEQREDKQVCCSDALDLNNKHDVENAPKEAPDERNLEKALANNESEEPIKTPVRSKSKNKLKKKQSPTKTPLKHLNIDSKIENNITNSTPINNALKNKENTEENIEKPKSISPKELTKECVVVIQKKMFKTDKKETTKKSQSSRSPKKNVESIESQIIFDSSDEVPLSKLNTIENNKQKDESNIITIEDDDDFAETGKVPIKKLQHKNTSTTGLKTTKQTSKLSKASKAKTPVATFNEPKPLSQSSNSFDDDDEDFFESKKTILIRKTYDKVTKPLKAKSTGSITQKDIDDLKARIEVKKKLLLAKATTSDTEELRCLIKKWQRGCQEALMELMDLMKAKCREKQNMDYSEILQTLKIPAVLVGYDSDNDCFNTPDDASIVLSKFDNL